MRLVTPLPNGARFAKVVNEMRESRCPRGASVRCPPTRPTARPPSQGIGAAISRPGSRNGESSEPHDEKKQAPRNLRRSDPPPRGDARPARRVLPVAHAVAALVNDDRGRRTVSHVIRRALHGGDRDRAWLILAPDATVDDAKRSNWSLTSTPSMQRSDARANLQSRSTVRLAQPPMHEARA